MPVIGTGTAPQPGTGNSTRTLQSVVDFCRSIGDLAPVFSSGGWSNSVAITIANAVQTDMFAAPMNWKWNRIVIPPFYTISIQQDYALVNQGNIGWLEDCNIVDINNTMVPKPLFWIECVKDLPRTSFYFGRPAKVCWLVNETMVQGVWPGNSQTFTNPLGAAINPTNPVINILDPRGNILVLTTYGITAAVGTGPDAGANPVVGSTVNDGTCVWTVASSRGQGFRVSPMPSQTTLVWQVNIRAQAKARTFTALANTLDPIPDDASKYFEDGFIAYLHRHSPNPNVRNRFEEYKRNWMQSMMIACSAAAREKEDSAFIPATSIMDQPSTLPAGPAWPWGSSIG